MELPVVLFPRIYLSLELVDHKLKVFHVGQVIRGLELPISVFSFFGQDHVFNDLISPWVLKHDCGGGI